MINAKYTVVLKTLLDDERTKEAIEKAMSTYPIYRATNEFTYGLIPERSELNQKILNHYKYREIGFETIGRFLDELEIALNEIMPYYNQLYKSLDLMNGLDDIFGNVDMTETFEQSSEGSSKGNTTGEAETNSKTNSKTNSYNKNVSSETPQGNIQYANKDIDSVTHANQIDWQHNTADDEATNEGKDTTKGTSNQESTSKTTHTLTRKGNQGVNTYAHDVLEFRELFMNIEQRIINDPRIVELFMLVY